MTSLLLLAAIVPLQWNPTYRTDVPYEVELSPKKLGLSSFVVHADGNPLETAVFVGKAKDTVDLRFTVPAGTKKLWVNGEEKVEVEGEGEERNTTVHLTSSPSPDSQPPTTNLFADALDGRADRWKVDARVRKEAIAGGLKFSALEAGTRLVSYEIDLGRTADCPPLPVKFEFDVRNVAIMTSGALACIRQIDANGEQLPEAVSDPRWSTAMRPPQVASAIRERGVIHPRARKLRFVLELHAIDYKFDEFGMPRKSGADALPQFEITRLALRPACELPFPCYDAKTFFGKGVSETAGDCSLKLATRQNFWYQTRGQGSWAGSPPVQYRDERDIYFPAKAGTVEAFFKPDWAKRTQYDYILFEGSSHTIATTPKAIEYHGRGVVFTVRYQPSAKKLSFLKKDMKNREFKGEATADIPSGVWTHVACTFEPGKVACVYLNGRKALEVSLAGYEPLDLANDPLPNNTDFTEFYIGSGHVGKRMSAAIDKKKPALTGEVDLLRVSTGVRYRGDFTPAKTFAPDADTRALFTFDDTFDGVAGGGLGVIPGTCHAMTGRRLNVVEMKGEKRADLIQYYPKDILPENDPAVVLDKLTYPRMPTEREFKAARRPIRKTFRMKPGEKADFTAGDEVYADYVEIANTGDRTLVFPVILNSGDIDPRSFGDFAESLGTMGLSDREKVNKTFNFLLRASDYHISDTATYAPDENRPSCVMDNALRMINGYCGFECGPLNTMASHLFACAARCPANMTGGYGHSFQQVFFDGKNHIYDLSAQKFFPSFDNETSVYLEEDAAEPGVHTRMEGSEGHFIRQATRSVGATEPGYCEKIGVSVNPGERFRVWFDNAAIPNDLFCSARMDKWIAGKTRPIFQPYGTYEKETFADTSKFKMRRMERVFPQYANGFLTFEGRPTPDNAAFMDEGKSFRYRVASGYPIVAGEYTATLKGGKVAANEFSFDGGRTWVDVGAGEITYPVRARHGYWVRVKAPMKQVTSFSARTVVHINARIFPGRVRAGRNEYRLKAEAEGAAEVTIAWRENAAPIEIVEAVPTGTLPGAEKFTVALDPSKEPLVLTVKGASDSAKVEPSVGLTARLENGRLTVASVRKDATFVGYVNIVDGGAVKPLTVVVAPNVRFVRRAALLKKEGDKAEYAFDPLPAGDYLVMCVDRFASHPKAGILATTLALSLDAEPKITKKAAAACNPAVNYYKAQYAHPGERANWKWDYPLDPKTFRPFWAAQKYAVSGSLDKVVYSVLTEPDGGAEIAAVMVMPYPENEFRSQLFNVLCGVNSCPERVRAK